MEHRIKKELKNVAFAAWDASVILAGRLIEDPRVLFLIIMLVAIRASPFVKVITG